MPRHVRVEFAGAICPVTIRGNAGQKVFVDDDDRERFLRRLAESVETYGVRLYLYCLMSNHVHLLIETPSANLHRFMQSLETGYTVYYNLRHGITGHLFQGRYKAKLVEGDDYLLKLSRYVHLNPVNIGKLKNLTLNQRIGYLRNYRWSSYRSYTGEEKKLEYVTYGPVLAQTGVKKGQRQKEYRRFVEKGLAKTDDDFLEVLKASPSAIGGDEFMAWVRDACLELSEKAAKPEDISFRRELPRMSREQVLEVVGKHLGVKPVAFRERRRNSLLRPIAAWMLVKYAGLTHRQVAETFGTRSGASASLQSRKLCSLKEGNKKVEKLMAGIEEELHRQISKISQA